MCQAKGCDNHTQVCWRHSKVINKRYGSLTIWGVVMRYRRIDNTTEEREFAHLLGTL